MDYSFITDEELEHFRATDPAKHAAIMRIVERDEQGRAQIDMNRPEFQRIIDSFPPSPMTVVWIPISQFDALSPDCSRKLNAAMLDATIKGGLPYWKVDLTSEEWKTFAQDCNAPTTTAKKFGDRGRGKCGGCSRAKRPRRT